MNGTVEKTVKGYRLRLERHLNHSPARVWAALTEPEQLAKWLAEASIDLRPGGKLQLRFGNTGSIINGEVVQVIPESLFEFTWNSEKATETLVHWELHQSDSGCRLVLTHEFPDATQLPSMLAGWHTHLEGLPAAATGQKVEWPWERWHELYRIYQQQVSQEIK